jgi:hypothetical protein
VQPRLVVAAERGGVAAARVIAWPAQALTGHRQVVGGRVGDQQVDALGGPP